MFQAFPCILGAVHMAFVNAPVEYYTAQKDETRFSFIFSSYNVQSSFKERGDVSIADKHEDISVGAAERDKGCFRPVFLPDFLLPVYWIRI